MHSVARWTLRPLSRPSDPPGTGEGLCERTTDCWRFAAGLAAELGFEGGRLAPASSDKHAVKARAIKKHLLCKAARFPMAPLMGRPPAGCDRWRHSSAGAPEERLREFHQSAHSTASVISSFRRAAGLLSALNAGRNPSSVHCTSPHSPLFSGSRTPCSTRKCSFSSHNDLPQQAERALLSI